MSPYQAICRGPAVSNNSMHPPALPEECEEVYSGVETEISMNTTDREEVKNLIASLSPASRKGAWWKDSLPIAIIMGGIGFLAYQFVPALITSQTSSMAGDIAVLKNDVGTIKADVSELRKDIKDQLVKALEVARRQAENAPKGSPKEHGALRFGNTVLDMARTFGVSIDEPVLSSYGRPIIQAGFTAGSRNGSEAQIAALTLLNYLSFLNIPRLPAIDPSHGYWLKDAEGVRDAKLSGARWLNRTPGSPMKARYDTIGSNMQYDPTGPDVFMITGGEADLDNMHIENAVFRDVHIVYRGAPLDMKSVWFVNCTFDVSPGPRGQQFADSILAPAPTSLRTV